jgi:hypothetical protein
MQRLIDAAVMVVPMIIPSLGAKFGQKALHGVSLGREQHKSAMKQI